VRQPVITFLSDYGLVDDFVGVCHGVIARICPPARIIDITHGIPRHDVRVGAIVLADALPYMPDGVHLAVVDPDVGASRRAVAVSLADGRRLVGPDNGLLSLAAAAGGGVVAAVDIAQSPLRLEPVSATFHGRDLFAPVAAQLAAGVPLAEAGLPVDPDALVGLELSRPHVGRDGVIEAHVLYRDRFGNLGLDLTHDDLPGSGLRVGQRVTLAAAGHSETARFVRTFADGVPGELIVYEDAYRRVAVAVSHGDGAQPLSLAPGDALWIEPA
jgi:S-adenosyl-L-methionine hydrolase (adenosine-forming)